MIANLPTPRETDPTAAPVLRWGICGPGDIADSFATAVRGFTRQTFVAVGSRSKERAEAFARKHEILGAYGSYEAVVNDPKVDIVYVAVPDGGHHELALEAIRAGKHVLVEKPLAMNGVEAREVVAAARAAGVFAMEALWSRYLPQADIIRQLIANGDLGTIRAVEASFGFAVPYSAEDWKWNPTLGSGALLQFGVYPLSYVGMILGSPANATALARGAITPEGLDTHSAVILDYGQAQATVITSMVSQAPITATIYGSAGYLTVDETFVVPSGLQFAQADGPRLVWKDLTGVADRGGLCYEAAAAARYIAEGLTESPLHPLDEVVATIELVDDIKRQLRQAGQLGVPPTNLPAP